MTLATRQFERVANVVTERISELLSARVMVLDDRGVVIAQSAGYANASREPALVGFPFELNSRAAKTRTKRSSFRLPIRFNGRSGEVIIGESEEGEAISPRLTQKLVEMIVNQTAEVAQLPSQDELKNKFIHDLLHGSIANEADILRQGQILGMDLTKARAVILIDAADYIVASAHTNARVWQQVQFIINSIVSFFHLPNDTICAYIGEGEVAVLKASSTSDLVLWANREDRSSQSNPSWANLVALKRASSALLKRLRCNTNESISIGIGRHHPGIEGLAKSYQDARAALSLGRRLQGPNQVYCLDKLGIAAFVGISDESTKIELAKHLLSPLDQEPDLLETLDAFFVENCCPSSTAKRLSIHRNTLSYRLDKITSLTGLDPRQFDDAMQIRLAFLLRSLVYVEGN
ncbi:MAG TPA: helix-turn-helix domain-containing protein [Coleofasciculaceae cyanobacterium]